MHWEAPPHLSLLDDLWTVNRFSLPANHSSGVLGSNRDSWVVLLLCLASNDLHGGYEIGIHVGHLIINKGTGSDFRSRGDTSCDSKETKRMDTLSLRGVAEV